MNDAHGAAIRPGKTASRPSTLDRRAKTAIAVALIAAFGVGPAEAANTLFVNTAGDPGPMGTTSLRQAVAAANAGDTIKFEAALSGSTITLAGGEIGISKEIVIVGLGSSQLTISGNDASRVFNVDFGDSTKKFKLYDLSLVHGKASAGCGGAVFATDSFLYLTNMRISQSSALSGGGICVQDGAARVDLTAVFNNSATTGGGISFAGPSARFLEILLSTISGNEASDRGGGIYAAGGVPSSPELILSRATVSGNRVMGSGGGGGMFLAIFGSAQSEIYDCTIAENYAHSGGGGVVTAYATTSHNLYIGNSTIVSNTTLNDADGNGLRAVGAQLGKLKSSIVANNSSAAGAVDLSGSFYASFNLVRNAGTAVITGANNLFGADPLLGRLANHGGSTKTLIPAAESPVIDSGSSVCLPSASKDQRLFERCVGGPDIGAVERQSVEDFVFQDSFDLP
jgi:hypothetical protein